MSISPNASFPTFPSSSTPSSSSSSSLLSSSSPFSSSLSLTPDLLSEFTVGRVFNDNTAGINAMDFRPSGDLLVTSSDDESIHLYSIDSGSQKKTILSKKYGVDLIRFTHHSNTVIVGSKNQWDFSLRYLSLHDNRYLRYFRGHRSAVISLSMSPSDDSFVSTSLDQTMRMWDLRVNQGIGLLKVTGRSQVQYDPQGLIFSVATGGNIIKLYDKRSFDKGPFATFNVENNSTDNTNTNSSTTTNNTNNNSKEEYQWSSLKFSPDGKYILLSTQFPRLLMLDSFDGTLCRTFGSDSFSHSSPTTALSSCWSPDGQFVLSGDESGAIHIWDSASGEERAVWSGHKGAVRCVEWCPNRMCIASACEKLALWIPVVK